MHCDPVQEGPVVVDHKDIQVEEECTPKDLLKIEERSDCYSGRSLLIGLAYVREVGHAWDNVWSLA